MRLYNSNPKPIQFYSPGMKASPYGSCDKKNPQKDLYTQLSPFLAPLAIGIAYSRTKSIPKAIGAGIIAPIYLAYVGYQTVKK